MSADQAKSDLDETERRIAQLRAELVAQEERASKIRAYLELAQLYNTPRRQPDVATQTSDSAPSRRTDGGVTGRTVAAVEAMLRAEQKPILTRVLFKRLADEHGIEIGGKEPVANLSGILSRSGKFVNDRIEGWSLKSEEQLIEELLQ